MSAESCYGLQPFKNSQERNTQCWAGLTWAPRSFRLALPVLPHSSPVRERDFIFGAFSGLPAARVLDLFPVPPSCWFDLAAECPPALEVAAGADPALPAERDALAARVDGPLGAFLAGEA